MRTVAIVAAALALAMSSAAWSAPLAERHVAKSMPCSVCHGKKAPMPGDIVESETCLKCHPRDAIVKKFVKDGPRNPHDNHLGEVDCTVCHLGHKPSKAYCANCHKNFELKMK